MNNQDKFEAILYLEFGKLEKTMEWCRNNCKHSCYIQIASKQNSDLPFLVSDHESYKFVFLDEKDCINFILKFK